ncbi:MmgE/PrpD family protein [Halomonas sp. HL-93]|uniref:MmgE/PrpD family protein n=1 Tax=Halomonas sp. HL-93 TaxID=1666906 RepID=UPI0007F07B57|nr:MmgE/PrpD family protein [Halomonas sp. HL-93]SBR46119.1 2-methylcitrate dehydratase PrpD [Halomonas sp. HL-93]
MSNLTQRLVADLQRIMIQEPDEAARHQVKRCLLDYLGAALAGARVLEPRVGKIIGMAGENKDGVGVIGSSVKIGIETAALINGLSSHVAEMDDGVRFGMIHPGAPIFSALIPMTEKLNVTGNDFIRGVLVGYDAALRLASAMQPTHYRRGYHPTATCGAIGATMGIAAMLGFNAQEMENALAAASVSATGSLKVVDKGSELKPYSVGRAAVLAVHSAIMARAGFSAPEDALNGDTGFLRMTTDEYREELILANGPSGYWIHSVYVKPYAACRHAHPSIEGTIRILEKAHVLPVDIKNIHITTYHGLAGRHDHKEVSDISAARMSVPFSVALAIKTGSAGINEFTQETVDDAEIRALARKVTISADQKYTDRVPDQRAAELRLETNDGTVYRELVTFPKGEPENPLTDAELEEKFTNLAGYGGVAVEKSDLLKNEVWQLPQDLKAFHRLLQN